MARRRAVGEGSVYYETKRDRWLGAITLASGQRVRVVAKNRTEAREKLDRLRRSADVGQVPTDGNATVTDTVNLWSARVLAGRRLAPRTRERYERHCAVVIGRDRSARRTSLRG